jgi:WD40 repeat protein
MKPVLPFFLVCIMLLAACVPRGAATSSATPSFTSTARPTATPVLTQTPEPTLTLEPTPVPVSIIEKASFHFDSCSWIVRSTLDQAGHLQVIYTLSDGIFIELPEEFAGLVNNDYRRQLWSWREDTQKAAPFLQPQDALGARLSADLQWIVFRRDIEKAQKSEIWVIDSNGKNERKLAEISYREVKARNPTEDSNVVYLDYGWVPNTDKVYYSVEIAGVEDTFALVDIHSGQQFPLAESGTSNVIVFAPDGSQAAVLTTSAALPAVDAANSGSQPAVALNYGNLRLVDTNDGSLLFTVSIPVRNDLGHSGSLSLDYSPDGKYVIGFSRDGIVRISAKAGAWQNIPLDYTIISPYVGAPYSPQFTWTGDATLLVPVTNLPNGMREININDIRADPDATFTIWQVDLQRAMTQPIQTFKGPALSVNISPSGNYVVFDKPEVKAGKTVDGVVLASYQPVPKMGAAPPPDILLADLKTGEILTTLEKVVRFSWSPYSDLFIYSQPGKLIDGMNSEPILLLGQIGAEPIPLGEFGMAGPVPLYIRWLDAQRLVLEDGCQLVDLKLSVLR